MVLSKIYVYKLDPRTFKTEVETINIQQRQLAADYRQNVMFWRQSQYSEKHLRARTKTEFELMKNSKLQNQNFQ